MLIQLVWLTDSKRVRCLYLGTAVVAHVCPSYYRGGTCTATINLGRLRLSQAFPTEPAGKTAEHALDDALAFVEDSVRKMLTDELDALDLDVQFLGRDNPTVFHAQ